MNEVTTELHPRAILQWYLESEIDEAINIEPVNRMNFVPVQEPAHTPVQSKSPPPPPAAFAEAFHGAAEHIATAKKLAESCNSLDALRAAVQAFEGCAIRKMATNTVFADGTPDADVMIIGEAPGAQEDREGIPFCGPSGQLLDKMFAAIDLNRTKNLYISNTLFWRPPGNRAPTSEELAICQPFVQKHIALVKPKVVVLTGGIAVKSLLQKEQSMSRLRGKLYEYNNPYLDAPIPACVMYHPSYLLRSPSQKRLAWEDLLLLQEFLRKQSAVS